jgi:Rrf2 family protein
MAIHYIAVHEDVGAVSVKRIAEEFAIPPELLAKILQRLAKERLIISQNGPRGGYVLARRPIEITVGQVVTALEGPINIVECLEEDSDCPQMARCNLRRRWRCPRRLLRRRQFPKKRRKVGSEPHASFRDDRPVTHPRCARWRYRATHDRPVSLSHHFRRVSC